MDAPITPDPFAAMIAAAASVEYNQSTAAATGQSIIPHICASNCFRISLTVEYFCYVCVLLRYLFCCLVPVGLKAAADSAGYSASEQCGTRLNRCKLPPHNHSSGKISRMSDDVNRCTRRVASSPDDEAPEPCSKKRKISSDVDGTRIHVRLDDDSLLRSDPDSMRLRGRSFSCGTRSSRSLAADWLQLVTDTESRGVENWKVMRSGFEEASMLESLECPFLDQLRVKVVTNAEEVGRQALRDHEIDESKLIFNDISCLRTATGVGQQDIHADVHNKKLASQCYQIILYLVETVSTAVSDLTLKDTKAIRKMSASDAAERFSTVNFWTQRVNPGEYLIASGECLHYGVNNPDKYPRHVGFLSYSPVKVDTNVQYYPLGV